MKVNILLLQIILAISERFRYNASNEIKNDFKRKFETESRFRRMTHALVQHKVRKSILFCTL